MTRALMEWETLDSEQIDDIMAGREPTPPQKDADDSAAAGGGPEGRVADGTSGPEPRMDEPAGGEA